MAQEERYLLTRKMVDYLESKINCENIMKFADSHNVSNENDFHKKLVVNKIKVAFEIYPYDRVKDKEEIDNIHQIYEFITESNYTGFEYFPYLYGVLVCHENIGNSSYLYTFYEEFDSTLDKLINEISHPSEWYDVVFQLAMINDYLQNSEKYQYNSSINNHLYRRLEKPITVEYNLLGQVLKIRHSILIVVKDFKNIKKITDDEISKHRSNIIELSEYLTNNTIKTMPSDRILKLINVLIENIEDTSKILGKYYSAS